jgi:hypothetical protein
MKQFVGYLVKKALRKGKVSPTIKSFKPNVPKTKGEKLKRDLKLATQKSKTAGVKLDNTIFRIKQQKKRLEEQRDKNKKMGGGFMGKRMGYKGGSKPDFLDLDKDGNTSEPMKQAAKQAKRKK